MMSARTIGLAVLVYLAPLGIAGGLFPRFASEHGGLSFIVAAILACQVAAYLHWRSSQEPPTTGAKITLGFVLATVAAVAGVIWQLLTHPFEHAEIVIGISALGTVLFPLVIVSQMWKTLAKLPRK